MITLILLSILGILFLLLIIYCSIIAYEEWQLARSVKKRLQDNPVYVTVDGKKYKGVYSKHECVGCAFQNIMTDCWDATDQCNTQFCTYMIFKETK